MTVRYAIVKYTEMKISMTEDNVCKHRLDSIDTHRSFIKDCRGVEEAVKNFNYSEDTNNPFPMLESVLRVKPEDNVIKQEEREYEEESKFTVETLRTEGQHQIKFECVDIKLEDDCERDVEIDSGVNNDIQLTQNVAILNPQGKDTTIVENTLQIITTETNQSMNANLIKEGLKRKRQTYDTTVQERKQRKLIEKREKYHVKPPCHEKCKKNCRQNINEDSRRIINNEYWKFTWMEQRNFILNNTERLDTKRKNVPDSARSNTYIYYFKNIDGEKVQVCKTFFLTTLGYNQSNDKVVQNALAYSKNNVSVKPDMRGKHVSARKFERNILKEHILSFHPCVSHYCREHVLNRKYLPSDVSIALMYANFKEKYPHKQCSYDLYRVAVKELNISFAKIGQEECESCAIFLQHKHKETLDPTCNQCESYSAHMERASESCKSYQQDVHAVRSSEDVCYSADLQKVVMLPRLDQSKIALFSQRIVLFNECFVPVGTTQNIKPIAAIWHEGIAGREKEDIISAFHAFFKANRDAKVITMWLDNSSVQNKNWCLFTYLIYIVNSEKIDCNEIIIKYFEPGHSFMSTASFHHQIEQSMKYKKNIYDFNDFNDAVQCANSGKVTVIKMGIDSFFDWVDHTSQAKLEKTEPRPYLDEIIKVVARRGSNNLKYWTDNYRQEEGTELNFLKAKVAKDGIADIPLPRKNPRGVSASKKIAIIRNLCPLMPSSRKEFWENLSESDVPDLSGSYSE